MRPTAWPSTVVTRKTVGTGYSSAKTFSTANTLSSESPKALVSSRALSAPSFSNFPTLAKSTSGLAIPLPSVRNSGIDHRSANFVESSSRCSLTRVFLLNPYLKPFYESHTRLHLLHHHGRRRLVTAA